MQVPAKYPRSIATFAAVGMALAACSGSAAHTSTAQGGSGGEPGSSGTANSMSGAAAQSAGAGGSSAGSPNGGEPTAGGAPQAGGSSGASGSSGTDGSSGAGGGPALGGACSPVASLGCAGAHQKVTLICGAGGVWEKNTTCAAGQFCDSQPGVNVGLCADEVAECTGKSPGDLTCLADTVHRCGPDGLTSELVDPCTGYCDAGACVNDKDRCPDAASSVNCAADCGGPTTKTCRTNSLNCELATVRWPQDTVRTPPPSATCMCAKSPDRRVVYMAYVPGTSTLKVKAPRGWMFANKVETSLTAPDWCDAPLVDCLILPAFPGGALFDLVSTGADPGPRNLVFEAVAETATCQ